MRFFQLGSKIEMPRRFGIGKIVADNAQTGGITFAGFASG
jgi:hypothetical protein